MVIKKTLDLSKGYSAQTIQNPLMIHNKKLISSLKVQTLTQVFRTTAIMYVQGCRQKVAALVIILSRGYGPCDQGSTATQSQF